MQIHSSFHANLNKALSEKLPYELHWKEGQHTHQNTPCPHSRCCNLHVLPHAKRYGVLKDPSSAPTTEAKVELCRILLREMREPQVAPEVVKSTSRFLRSIKKGDVDPELSSVLAQLRDEHLAQRFGINVRVLEDNPGLADFLERNHLYYALKHYGHRIEVREETGEALLIMEGEWRDWTWIQNRVEQEAPQPPGPSQRPNWENVRYGSEAICKYTFEGIRLGPVTQWDTLEPFDWADPKDWGGGYAIDVCCNCTDKPDILGNHTWIRLKRPDGGILSVGQYRPSKETRKDHYHLTTSVKPASLCQPDISEFFPAPYETWTVRISEAQYHAIKKRVESDKRNSEEFYQLLHYNCTQYSLQLLAMAEVEVPSTMPAARILAPGRVVKVADSVTGYMPDIAIRACRLGLTFMMNCLQLVLGGTEVHPMLHGHPLTPPAPVIGSLWDMFKSEKVHMHHPYIVGQIVRKQILAWRDRMTQPLADERRYLERYLRLTKGAADGAREKMELRIKMLTEEIERIAFEVPPEFCRGERALQTPITEAIAKPRL